MNPTSRPQKSSLWLWTTLWLTAFIDSGLIFSVFILLVGFLPGNISSSVGVFLTLIILLISLWLGAYFAVKYVLRKSIVPKLDAGKLASLAVVVPVIFWGFKFLFGGFDLIGIIVAIITIAVIYISIKKMIEMQGD